MSDWHSILDGKVNLYKRAGSPKWQCSTYLAGKEHHRSTKEDNLIRAEAFAENWYLELRGKLVSGEIKNEKTFKQAEAKFEQEYEVITEGERSSKWVQGHKDRILLHLTPFLAQEGYLKL